MASSELRPNQTPNEQAQDSAPQPEIAPGTPKPPVLKSATWIAEIDASQAWMRKWHEQGRRIQKRFLDRRDENGEKINKINIFTSNTGILISTLYAKFPKPMVTREFEDQDDDVARVAAEILERMLKIRPRDDMDEGMKAIVQDRLVPGAGSLWFRYNPITEQTQIPAVVLPDGTEESPASIGEEIVDEEVLADYVYWEDLLWSPARTWKQVRWVAKRCRMSREDVVERFGEEIAKRLTYVKGYTSQNQNAAEQTQGEHPEGDQVLYVEIFELWHKRTRKVYWVTKGIDVCLDVKDDPLGLKKFWPMPKPIMATHSTGNFLPRPDFLLAQDQYEELDMVNNRITMLERAIKAVGVYDGTDMEIERIFTEEVDNKIIAKPGMREFMEKGGFKGAIDWIPIEMFVNALDKLRTYRQDLIQQIYELTGISDIMRGSSKASETLGAQELKAQYGSVKLQHLQMEVASFLEEALQIKAEIISNRFQPQTIDTQSNIMNSLDREHVPAAIELIKSGAWDYRVEVHADSMAVPEFNSERDGRMNFMRAIAEMMVAADPMMQREPAAGVTMLRMIQWAAASFRTGRTVEGLLDKAIIQIEKVAQNPPPPPPPNPKDVAVAKRDTAQAHKNDADAIKTQVETDQLLGLIPQPPAEPGGEDSPTTTH